MRVTVAIPAYNHASFIEECLRSIRASQFRDYELLVVDDGSTDETAEIARRYADRVICHATNRGQPAARDTALNEALGDILVYADADVVLFPDTLNKITAHFDRRPDADAVAGYLDKKNPNPDAVSQYKNLYVHYHHRALPEEVDFLYGSLYAVRRNRALPHETRHSNWAEDTRYGLKLSQNGRRILFGRDITAVHLHRYTLPELLQNDFRLSEAWVHIVAQDKGWKKIFSRRPQFAQVPGSLMAAVALAPQPVWLTAAASLDKNWIPAAIAAWGLWFFLNRNFLGFCARERGLRFCIAATAIAFLDQNARCLGIICGILKKITTRS